MDQPGNRGQGTDDHDRRQAEDALERCLSQLGERVKELNCLYSISRLVDQHSLTIAEILQGVVDLMPTAWQYPQNACAQLVLDDDTYQTANFQSGQRYQSADIVVAGKIRGRLEVHYCQSCVPCDEGPFLIEERILIDAVAERVGKITERKEAEHLLRASERRFRDVLKNALIGILIIQDGQVVFKNPEMDRLLGPVDQTFDLATYKGIHPADAEKVKLVYQNLSTGKSRQMDTEFRFFHQDHLGRKETMRWVYSRASVIEYGKREAVLINMIDMTRDKELERLLVIQDKMASLGRVAAGIAHEIRNPLSGINIYLNTLGKLLGKQTQPDKVEEILDNLQSASHRIEGVIRRVMDFSKPGAPRLAPVDPNQAVQEALNLTATTLRKKGIAVSVELAADLPAMLMDRRMIEEVILNLTNNAVDALDQDRSRKSKRIRIISAADGDGISITVSDSGPGVPEHLREKIFDPFYTTKRDSTGIGLNLCHRIVTDHGGTIRVGPGKDGGAEFVITLPHSVRKNRQ